MISTAADLRRERLELEHRLKEARKGIDQVQKENAMLKMKSTMALGQARLQAESAEEDEQILVDKHLVLQRKVQLSEQSLQSKANELATLQSTLQEEHRDR